MTARPASIHRIHRNQRGERGLTLAELLTALAVMAILAAAAYPTFQDLLARQQVALAADRLAASLALARATALGRRTEVMLEPLAGETTLDHGWQLVANPGAIKGRTVLSVVEPGMACLSVTLRQTARGTNGLKFLPVGYSRSEQGGFQAATFALSCRGAQRQVRLGAQGRIRLCTPGRDSDCDAADGPEPP
ncbi:GspH/FimT family pseudopilin [Cupriavidus sp. AcVe19-1a]|uniref:GspH/FimT family pseudopilin n=1 Tax=Cupriavidus sp. AcVe19-1a TaxID=2821359 RepID=UPI001AE38BB5|nr:GspH/FimT family pseudopilin [Cupriavidus sp. AcVe19-1a]MBP0629964.1 GspH/FimT family pseudopilin [Cupriavidus sp. AcVe19-1a]